jgi:polyphosphate kinase
VWIGSADLMHRNLDRRVEALVKVRDRAQRADLLQLMERAMDDNTMSWWLDDQGVWSRRPDDLDGTGEPPVDIQTYLMKTRRWKTVLGGDTAVSGGMPGSTLGMGGMVGLDGVGGVETTAG